MPNELWRNGQRHHGVMLKKTSTINAYKLHVCVNVLENVNLDKISGFYIQHHSIKWRTSDARMIMILLVVIAIKGWRKQTQHHKDFPQSRAALKEMYCIITLITLIKDKNTTVYINLAVQTVYINSAFHNEQFPC